jgi:hypothetical protein
MCSRAVVLAAAITLLLTATARVSVADVRLDALRAGDERVAWQCPERIARAAAQATHDLGHARSVHAEFIGGQRTLDLDLVAGGAPRPAFRLRFAPQRQASRFMLALFMNDGSSRSACVVLLPPREASFDMEFPLAGFRQALGVADYRDVDYILLVAMRAEGPPAAAQAPDTRVVSIAVTGARQGGALTARCR